jgi:hypothetical protein
VSQEGEDESGEQEEGAHGSVRTCAGGAVLLAMTWATGRRSVWCLEGRFDFQNGSKGHFTAE